MWILFFIASLLSEIEFEAQPLAGPVAAGQLLELDEKQVVIQTSAGRSSLAVASLANLVRRGPAPIQEPKAGSLVQLIDQSVLAAAEFSVQGANAILVLADGAKLKVPTRAIRSVRFKIGTEHDAKLDQQWSDIAQTKLAGDLLVVRTAGALDYLEGVQGDVDADTCKFELENNVRPVKRAKVEGIIYSHPATADTSEPIGRLATLDGTRLEIKTLRLAEGVVHIGTPGGVSIDMPLESVSRFDFSTDKIRFLSDLVPTAASYAPYLNFKEELSVLRDFYQFRRDVSFERAPLSLDGKIYRKGLALQSRTTLTYKLPARFRAFKATVGIDDGVRDTGNVGLEIRGDDKSLWKGDIKGSEPAQELELDIGTVKRIEIVVDYGDGLDVGDRLVLADARVMK